MLVITFSFSFISRPAVLAKYHVMFCAVYQPRSTAALVLSGQMLLPRTLVSSVNAT